ncbi:hypothetical protein [Methylobacterium frigidaeris]|uniref:Uncharacterized protein n=1 Tax=Methylobacterium frigidaeris TaxID=2038277 RepID=A0AA37M701_9HYPH|nr:hypothetical protein [Methylobacterium frigidaeris]PIK74822.1 hypothetical protein CS379_00550 [Methylobacterium frigidaeris]GJD65170.1 hypothetical protein MPEAHAMD_5357 [Methylobacterium frigidaeris]
MRSLFDVAARVASRTHDQVQAERLGFRLERRTAPVTGGRPDVNARPVARAGSPPVDFDAVWVSPGAMLNAHGRAMSDASTKAIAGEKFAIDIDDRALVPPPVADDKITRLYTGASYAVTNVTAVDYGRTRIWLRELR